MKNIPLQGTGEMGQRLRALAALTDDWGLIPSTQTVTHKTIYATPDPVDLIPSSGLCVRYPHPLVPSVGTAHIRYTDICYMPVKHPYT